jgi:hypothetical protein
MTFVLVHLVKSNTMHWIVYGSDCSDGWNVFQNVGVPVSNREYLHVVQVGSTVIPTLQIYHVLLHMVYLRLLGKAIG